MCLTNAYFERGDTEEEILLDVSRIEAQDGGFLLIGLLGEQKTIQGKIKIIDFANEHKVVFETT